MNVSHLRFGTLLKVRKYQEKKAQQELSQIRNQKVSEEQALSQLDEQRNAEINGTDTVEKIRAQDVQTSRAFIRSLTRDMQTQQKRINEIQRQETNKTGEVVERKQAKEVVENLEDKYQTHLAKERDKKEQRMLDILARRTHKQE
jgi:flagellar export protein FliJ